MDMDTEADRSDPTAPEPTTELTVREALEVRARRRPGHSLGRLCLVYPSTCSGRSCCSEVLRLKQQQ